MIDTKRSKGKLPFLLNGALFFCLFVFVNSVLAKSGNLHEVADNLTDGSRYSDLFDQLIILEQQGKYIEALRLISQIYSAEDIPVDAFYLTLDKKREELLEVVIKQNISFRIGKEKSTCSGIQRLFTDRYIGKSDAYPFFVPVSDDLEYERFCYLLIAEGHLQKTPWKGSLLLPSTSRFKLQSALDSADPWLVSAALFFARKQEKPTISAQAVIDRWERRPDLWDQRCIQQAKLFIAQLGAETVRKLRVSNEDIQMQLAELQAVPSDKSYLSPLLFSSIDSPKFLNIKSNGIKLVKLEANDKKAGVIKRWAGDKNQFSNLEPVSEIEITADDFENEIISVEPGFYRIKFNSVSGMPPSGYYGQSNIVEVQGGKLFIVPVPLFPAILKE